MEIRSEASGPMRAPASLLALLGILLLWHGAQPSSAVGNAAQPQDGPSPKPFSKPFPPRWVNELPAENVRPGCLTGWRHAVNPGDLQLSVALWPGQEITAGEPIVAHFSIANPGDRDLFFPFIGSVSEAIHFAVYDSESQPVGRPYQPPPPRGDGRVEMFRDRATRHFDPDSPYQTSRIALEGRGNLDM